MAPWAGHAYFFFNFLGSFSENKKNNGAGIASGAIIYSSLIINSSLYSDALPFGSHSLSPLQLFCYIVFLLPFYCHT